MKKPKYVSQEILNLLAQRHSKDVFIPECKDGPTHYTTHVRMDAWAMNISWAHPVVSAYEVKVSRADFLQDNKWPAYLPLCNQFYFVAPAGLIDISELPAEAGLLTIAGKGDGARLLTKKKAPHRDVTIPEEVYRYILMCRVKTTPEEAIERVDSVTYWQKWLNEKQENQKLGWRVSQRVAERAAEVEAENYRLRREIEKFAELQQWLDSQGFRIHDWALQSHIEERHKAQSTVFDQSLVHAMREARNKIDTALSIAQQVEDQAKQEAEKAKAEAAA